jgi:surface polysaccharide O-acyltransferase-like enzyme
MYDSDKIIRKMLKYFSIITAIVVIIYVFYSILIVKNRKAQEKQQLAYNKYIEKNKDAIHLADNIDNIDAGNKPIEGLSTDLQTVSELITLLDTFFENINNKDFNKALSMFDQTYCKEF